MKAFAASIFLLAAGMQPQAAASEYRTQPSICVILRDKDDSSASGVSLLNLKLSDGYFAGVGGGASATMTCYCGSAAGAEGPNGVTVEDDSTESSWDVAYTVNSVRPGHFILDVDCEVQNHGVPAKRIKRRLIVSDRAPSESNWLKLNDRFATYAYLTPTAIR